jgi:transposase-like protein
MLSKLNNLIRLVYYQFEAIKLLVSFIGIKVNPKPDLPDDLKYHHFTVDDPPIIDNPQILDYKELMQAYELEHGKPLKPVRRRKNSTQVSKKVFCPMCGAPHQFIYDNNGGNGSYKCKVCCKTFASGKYSITTTFRCPHCNKALDKIKERKSYTIYKCRNDQCSFYQDNLNSMNKHDQELFEIEPEKFKVHYIYRAFDLSMKKLKSMGSTPFQEVKPPKVDLSRIHASQYVLGLILTYRINYGLAARKVAKIMHDIHNVNISHQTIINYSNAAGHLIKPFIDHYDYDLSNKFCGDETYIRVKGDWHYIFYFFDATKKIILSYFVSPNRDTASAITAILSVIKKAKAIKGDFINLIVDGNPIYLLAKQFLDENKKNENLPDLEITRVIGLTNEDPISTKYRPLKQIIERLNRTFKRSYYTTYGFGSESGSIYYVNLFTAYFNFLREHKSLKYNVPVKIDSVQNKPNMPAKWVELIRLSYQTIESLNQAT